MGEAQRSGHSFVLGGVIALCLQEYRWLGL